MTETKTQTKTPKKYRIIPNTERVICKFINLSTQLKNTPILVAGQLKAGENLLCAQVVEGGTTKFKPGQIIYYSEYSASQMVDAINVLRAGGGMTEMNQPENKYIIIAEDDIMAYEEEIDPDFKVNDIKQFSYTIPEYKKDIPIVRP